MTTTLLKRDLIINLHKQGYTLEEISIKTNASFNYTKAVLKGLA